MASSAKRHWDELENGSLNEEGGLEEIFKRRRSAPALPSDEPRSPTASLLSSSRSISEMPLGSLLQRFPDRVQRSVQHFRDVAKRELRRLQDEQKIGPLAAAKTLVQAIRTVSNPSSPPEEEIKTLLEKGAPDEDVAIWALLVKDELHKLRMSGTETVDAVEILVSRMELLSARSSSSASIPSQPNPRKRNEFSPTSTEPSQATASPDHLLKRSRSEPRSTEPTPAPASTSTSASAAIPTRKRSLRTESSTPAPVNSNSANSNNTSAVSVDEPHSLDSNLKRMRSVSFQISEPTSS